MRSIPKKSYLPPLLGTFLINAIACHPGHTMDQQVNEKESPAITLLTRDLVQELSRYLTNKKTYRLTCLVPEFAQAILHLDLRRRDFGFYYNYDVKKIDNIVFQRMTTRLPNLTSLDLMNRDGLTTDIFAPLVILTNLKKITLKGCGTTDTILSHLAKLTNINDLNLEKNSIHGKGLLHLRGLTKLNTLNLSNYKGFSGDSFGLHLTHLGNLTNLTYLNLSKRINIISADIGHLTNLINLKSLKLGSYDCYSVPNMSLSLLTGFSNLTELDFYANKKGPQECSQLKSFPSLTSLSLSASNDYKHKLTDDYLSHLTILKYLTSLGIHGKNELTNEGLKNLLPLTTLQSLIIDDSPHISLKDLCEIKKLPKLAHLYFDGIDRMEKQSA